MSTGEKSSLNMYILLIIPMQGQAHYIFNPSVSVHHQIKDFSFNTSFYTLAEGSRNVEEMLVESLFAEVCAHMHKASHLTSFCA